MKLKVIKLITKNKKTGQDGNSCKFSEERKKQKKFSVDFPFPNKKIDFLKVTPL